MHRLPARLATGFAISLLLPGLAYAGRYVERQPFPVVTVVGEGQVTAVPDTADVAAGVSNDGKTPKEAAEANAKAMSTVINAARAAGIPDRDIGTTRYSIQPVYASKGRGEAQHVVGFRVTNMVRVTIRDLARMSEVLDQLAGAGATDIGNVTFRNSEINKKKGEARSAAFADAKQRAELYAKAAGVQLGRALSITEQESRAPQPMAMRSAMADSTPIMPGEDSYAVTVTVTFELTQ